VSNYSNIGNYRQLGHYGTSHLGREYIIALKVHSLVVGHQRRGVTTSTPFSPIWSHLEKNYNNQSNSPIVDSGPGVMYDLESMTIYPMHA
jgi:hypothetical protein